MKFGTLLSNLAKKAAVDVSTPEFIALLSHDIDIPDPIADSINKGLMDINAAKANKDVRNAIRTEALNGVDTKVDELLTELGLSDEDATPIKGEKNSYEKVALLTRKVKELEEKKSKSNKGADKEIYEKQIRELNDSIKAVKADLVKKEKEFNEAREGDLTNFEQYKLLLGKNYVFPDDMDTELKLQTALAAVNKSLQKDGFKMVRNPETGLLTVLKKDGTQAYNDKNELVEASSYIDGALAQNKLLKVTDQRQQQGGGNTHTQTQGGQQQNNPYYQQQVEETNKELAALGVTL